MATKGKTGKAGSSKMIWIIGGVILVAGGVGLYLYLRKKKKDEADKTGDSKNTGTGNQNVSTSSNSNTSTSNTSISNTSTSSTPTSSTPSSSTPSSSSVGSFSLNSTERIKAFQDWMDANKPFWILDSDKKYKNLRKGTSSEPNRHVGGKGYGTYGTNTQRVWKLFGNDYIKTLSSFEGESMFSNFESSLNLDL